MEEQGQRGFCGGVEEHVRVRRTEVGGRSSEACVGPWDGGGEGAARLVIELSILHPFFISQPYYPIKLLSTCYIPILIQLVYVQVLFVFQHLLDVLL